MALFRDGNLSGKKAILLDRAVYKIGRHSSNDIIVLDKAVSRFQATLIRRVNSTGQVSYWIVDGLPQGLRSSNGTIVNRERYVVRELKSGDILRLGKGLDISYFVINTGDAGILKKFNDCLLSQEDWGAYQIIIDPDRDILVKSKDSWEQELMVESTAIDNPFDAVVWVDAIRLKIYGANQVFLDLLGYDRSQLLKLSLYDIVDGVPEKLNGQLLYDLTESRTIIGETRYRGQSGLPIDVQVKASLARLGRQSAFELALRKLPECAQLEDILKNMLRQLGFAIATI
ncbi:MAG: FHA domain-containing protein [Chloroflexaceae bacterium]|nr:FHA domain-containing protein [Chloroflexaceae bacterium]